MLCRSMMAIMAKPRRLSTTSILGFFKVVSGIIRLVVVSLSPER